MKNYVITILDNDKSVEVAERCIESGKKFNMEISKFKAITPKDNPYEIMIAEGINPHDFEDSFSKLENMQACFLSHYFLWKKSIELNEDITIFEHDAVIMNELPDISFKGCINFGQPSYGKFITPKDGIQKLVSKQYFPGAHAYRVSPEGAKKLVERAKIKAGPADVFLHNSNFDFLEEYYPWPVIANDSFTTIQKQRGIAAKHNYQKLGSQYEILTNNCDKNVTVVCVFWGDKFSLDYVYNLKAMVERNTTVQHNFICFSDRQIPGIETILLPKGMMGWWNKIYLFNKDNGLSGRIVYFDLDTVIVNNIDWFMNWDGNFMGIEDLGAINSHQPHLKNKLQSPVLNFNHEKNIAIWDYYSKNKVTVEQRIRGDGEFLETILPKNYRTLLQDVFPNKLKSYKYHIYPNRPDKDVSIVCFHGRPSIIQSMTETVVTPMMTYEKNDWVKEYWNNE